MFEPPRLPGACRLSLIGATRCLSSAHVAATSQRSRTLPFHDFESRQFRGGGSHFDATCAAPCSEHHSSVRRHEIHPFAQLIGNRDSVRKPRLDCR